LEIKKENKQMQIDISELEYCKVKVQYKGDPEKVEAQRKKVIQDMIKHYPVKGFRTGKASPESIKHQHPQAVEAHLKEVLSRDAYNEVLTEKGFKPFGQPHFNSATIIGNNFSCEFALHVVPTVELKEYKGFDLPKFSPPSTVEEFAQKILEQIRQENGEQVPYQENEFVQSGDQVIVDCAASLENQPVEELSFTGTLLQIGRISIPGFDDNLLGMKLDEEREFSLKIPESFKPELANKILQFKVQLKMGTKQIPAPLDDTLAKKVQCETFDDLNQKVHSMATSRVAEWERNYLHDQISRRLITNHDFKIPHWLVLPEAQIRVKSNKEEWDKLSDEVREQHLKDAEDGIRLSLILHQIQQEEPSFQLTDEELLALTKNNLSQFSEDPEKIMQDLYQRGQIGAFLGRIKDEFVLDCIVKNCNIVE
jgi:trigger factor